MDVVDLAVVGGGYWGSSIAYESKRRGRSTILLDDADRYSGSRAASGICDPNAYQSRIFAHYLPPGWKEELSDSFNWLLDRGGVKTREQFWNKFRGTSPRVGAEGIYIPSVSTILRLAQGLTINSKLEGGGLGNPITLSAGGREYRTRKLVVAAGYRTDEVLDLLGLGRLGIKKLYGRGILARGTASQVLPVSVMIKPYVKNTVRQWPGGVYKIGDTAEVRPDDRKLENLRKVARDVLADYEEVEVSEGYRPVLDKFTVEKVHPNVVVATGGHRLGLGLCGLVAKKVIEALR